MCGIAQTDGRLPLYDRRQNVTKCENFAYHCNRGRSGANLNDTIKLVDPKTTAWYKNLGRISYTNRVIANTAVKRPQHIFDESWGELSCSALPAAKRFFAISKWRMVSNVLPKTFRNHNNLNCDRIFRAKRQLSLIPLNRTAALPGSAEQLNSSLFSFTAIVWAPIQFGTAIERSSVIGDNFCKY